MRSAGCGVRKDRQGLRHGPALRQRIRSSASRVPHSEFGFTLVEILVVLTIIAILMTALGITLRKVRDAAQSYTCKNKLKTVAFEFSLFADDYAHGGRGGSDELRGGGFYLRDFQDRAYRVDEFWELGNVQTITYPASRTPLICPSGPQYLTAQAGYPCEEVVSPQANVSVAFNMRLDRASVREPGTGWWVLAQVRLGARILERPGVPLAFDADGEAAAKRGRLPFYMAPPMGDPGKYGTGQFWHPAARHEREINACFVGGHVLATRKPLAEPGWEWAYQPPPED